MKSSMALARGGMGEPLGSAEEGRARLETTLLAGDAVEFGNTQDRPRLGGQAAGPRAPAPQATKGQSRQGCPSPWSGWKHTPSSPLPV